MSALRSIGNFAGGVTGGYLAGTKSKQGQQTVDIAQQNADRLKHLADSEEGAYKDLGDLVRNYNASISRGPVPGAPQGAGPIADPSAAAGNSFAPGNASALAQALGQPQAPTPMVTGGMQPRRLNPAIPYADNMPALSDLGG